MALKATLKIESKVYDVQDLDYRLSQPSDIKGKPTGITGGGIINFTILANKKDNFFFQEWVLSLATVKSGKFLLPITEGIDHEITEVDFKDAYCTDLHVFYNSFNEKQLFMKLSISPTKIIFRDGVEFLNKNLDLS